MQKKITADSLVVDIVNGNYRAADVFSKYNIDFCGTPKMSLIAACEQKGLNQQDLERELQQLTSADQNADQWPVDFMIDYLINIHHTYFKNNISLVHGYIDKFIAGHNKKFQHFQQIAATTQKLHNKLTDLLNYETKSLFPYVKRISYAYNNNEAYGKLFIKTLRKLNVEDLEHFHTETEAFIMQIEQLTGYFLVPDNACPAQKVMLQKLQEFIDYIRKHFSMEKEILIPAILKMEKSLLEKFTEL
jgi:regulator of cell morphogenesis and NO signaling